MSILGIFPKESKMLKFYLKLLHSLIFLIIMCKFQIAVYSLVVRMDAYFSQLHLSWKCGQNLYLNYNLTPHHPPVNVQSAIVPMTKAVLKMWNMGGNLPTGPDKFAITQIYSTTVLTFAELVIKQMWKICPHYLYSYLDENL